MNINSGFCKCNRLGCLSSILFKIFFICPAKPFCFLVDFGIVLDENSLSAAPSGF